MARKTMERTFVETKITVAKIVSVDQLPVVDSFIVEGKLSEEKAKRKFENVISVEHQEVKYVADIEDFKTIAQRVEG